MTTHEVLVQKAIAARLNAYAPYSRFTVGAALLTNEAKVFTGCNVENGVNGLSICAERVAVAQAVAQGHRKFKRIVIAASPLAPPCGSCRQFLIEFGKELEVTSIDPETGATAEWKLPDLLPDHFTLRHDQG